MCFHYGLWHQNFTFQQGMYSRNNIERHAYVQDAFTMLPWLQIFVHHQQIVAVVQESFEGR
jgi:hypothetical protein